MFFHVLPLSREIWNGPSFAPVQMTPASSLDSLLQALCVHEGGPDAAADAMQDDGDDEEEPAKRRKRNVRGPLYSLDLLSERDGMLQYLTGFTRTDIDLLTSRLREVVFPLPFFCSREILEPRLLFRWLLM